MNSVLPKGVTGRGFYVDPRMGRRTGLQVWPVWFGADNVFLSPDHVPYLQRCFETVRLEEHRAKVPYMPLFRVPYYTFMGRKAE